MSKRASWVTGSTVTGLLVVVSLGSCGGKSKEDQANEAIIGLRRKAEELKAGAAQDVADAEAQNGEMKALGAEISRPTATTEQVEAATVRLHLTRAKRRMLLSRSVDKLAKAEELELEALRLETQLIDLTRQQVKTEQPPELNRAAQAIAALKQEVEELLTRVDGTPLDEVARFIASLRRKLTTR